jgi:hypothetical protein
MLSRWINYCVVSYSAFEAELADVIPVVKTSIGGTRLVGFLSVGKLLLNQFSIYLLIYHLLHLDLSPDLRAFLLLWFCRKQERTFIASYHHRPRWFLLLCYLCSLFLFVVLFGFLSIQCRTLFPVKTFVCSLPP